MRHLSWGMGWIVKALLFASDRNSIRKFQEWGYKHKWIMKLKWCDKNAIFFSQSLDSASSVGFMLYKLLNIMLKMTHMTPPVCLDSKESLLQCGRPRFDPWIGKIHWRREWQPTPLPGELHGQKSLVGYCPWGTESDISEWLTHLITPHQVSNFRHA